MTTQQTAQDRQLTHIGVMTVMKDLLTGLKRMAQDYPEVTAMIRDEEPVNGTVTKRRRRRRRTSAKRSAGRPRVAAKVGRPAKKAKTPWMQTPAGRRKLSRLATARWKARRRLAKAKEKTT